MDQFKHNNESSPFKLPEVQVEPNEVNKVYENGVKSHEEQATARAVEQNSLTSTSIHSTPQAVAPLTVDPSILVNDNGLGSTQQTAKKITVTDNLQANDTDLIEKAWVVKAKAIVEQTKNNPFEQSNELTKIRTDYQNKRFNTNIKIENE